MVRTYHPNGNIRGEYNTKNELLDGYVKRYYPNGVLNFIALYKHGVKDGRLIKYDSLGNKIAEKNFVNDKKHGLFVYYYQNGRVESKSNYYKNYLHGQSLGYYENGVLQYKGFYTFGKEDDLFYYYYSSGKLQQIEEYKNGNLLRIKYYNEDGNFSRFGFGVTVKTESDTILLGDTLKAQIILYNADSFSNMVIRFGLATDYEYQGFEKRRNDLAIKKGPFNGSTREEFVPEKKGKFILHGGISFEYKGDKSYYSPFYKEIIVY